MKNKLLLFYSILTGTIFSLSGCGITDYEPLGFVTYIIDNETGHDFSLAIKNPMTL